MKIKKYTASTIQEAMLKVKMDLGKDALIINTRNIRGKGFFKFFKKPTVEVIAAVDEQKSSSIEIQDAANFREALNKQSASVIKMQNQTRLDLLESKFNSMEETLKNIYTQIKKISDESIDNSSTSNCKKSKKGLPQLFYDNLIKNEVDADIANELISQVCEQLGDNDSVNDFINTLYKKVTSLIGKPSTISLEHSKKPYVVIFAGPTGVGKTTTIAKLAAHYYLSYNKKVSMITADTYRIAAVEQLKVYADILGIPLSIVRSPGEMKEAIKNFEDSDLILIDTAGRSYRDTSSFEEIKQTINAADADEIYIVLSMTMSTRNCKEVLENYKFLNNYKIIFTKYDEISAPGIILNTLYYARKQVSYITTGQNVPDDIEVFDTDKIAKKIIGNIN
ncbi:MAG TPA: flagellar biosynthesis protein FlhF [Clostridiaceae bacterium]|nr:flagellar biosynthesis protein FlhF [Clostridiaceae bacterium]